MRKFLLGIVIAIPLFSTGCAASNWNSKPETGPIISNAVYTIPDQWSLIPNIEAYFAVYKNYIDESDENGFYNEAKWSAKSYNKKECSNSLKKYDFFDGLRENSDTKSGKIKVDLSQCLTLYSSFMHKFMPNYYMADGGRPIKELRELYVAWPANDAFNRENFRSQQHKDFSYYYQHLLFSLTQTYAMYRPLLQLTEEQDRAVLTWLDSRYNQIKYPMLTNQRCTDNVNNHFDSCNNVAALLSATLAMQGMMEQNSEKINKSLRLIQQVINGTDKDGSTIDRFRGGKAPSYMIQTAGWIEQTGIILRPLGIEVYDIKNKNGTSINDMFDYVYRVFENESINFKYAKQGNNRLASKGVDYRSPNYSWKKNDIRQLLTFWLYKNNKLDDIVDYISNDYLTAQSLNWYAYHKSLVDK